MLSVAGCSAPARGRELSRRFERRHVRVRVTGQSRSDFLEQPAITVGIAERGVRAITPSLWLRPAEASFLASMVEYTTGVMEQLAHLNAANERFVANCNDVGHDEIKSLRRARRR